MSQEKESHHHGIDPWEEAGLDKEMYVDYLRDMSDEDAMIYLEELDVSEEGRIKIVADLARIKGAEIEEKEKRLRELEKSRLKAPVWVPGEDKEDEEQKPARLATPPKIKKKAGVTVSGASLTQWLNAKKAPENPHEAASSSLPVIGRWQIVDHASGTDFVCSICLDLSRDPVILGCESHFACSACWTQLVSVARNKSLEADVLAAATTLQNTEKKPIICPLCKQAVPIHVKKLEDDPELWNKYLVLKLKCTNSERKERKCSWTGPLYEYDSHLEECDRNEEDQIVQGESSEPGAGASDYETRNRDQWTGNEDWGNMGYHPSFSSKSDGKGNVHKKDDDYNRGDKNTKSGAKGRSPRGNEWDDDNWRTPQKGSAHSSSRGKGIGKGKSKATRGNEWDNAGDDWRSEDKWNAKISGRRNPEKGGGAQSWKAQVQGKDGKNEQYQNEWKQDWQDGSRNTWDEEKYRDWKQDTWDEWDEEKCRDGEDMNNPHPRGTASISRKKDKEKNERDNDWWRE